MLIESSRIIWISKILTNVEWFYSHHSLLIFKVIKFNWNQIWIWSKLKIKLYHKL